jgi:predicted phage tail component-like protein
MSYFIFNDIRSDDMGIIVENIPPIIKPPGRYNLIEVDGNDNTRVELLGYKAYEKPIPIGLKDTDINRVLDWLGGAGKLILSNELDKYYDAFILEQIDYERALRFRKATVNFLVQPYKHATGEEETESRMLINQGNVDCLPLMTIYGSGAADVLINGIKACSVTISEYITLDSEEQEAYKGLIMQNRVMVGNFPRFAPGENELSFTGNVTNVKTLVRSRWR